MKILIIDDDVDLLEMTARRFSRKGAETFSASNLKEAVEKYQQHPETTGIVCDFFLQNGENGLTFYEEHIKGKFKGKFILATGDNSADGRIAKYIKEDSLFLCVEKPFSLDKIIEIFNA